MWLVVRLFLLMFGLPAALIGTLNTIISETEASEESIDMRESLFPKWMMLFGCHQQLTSACTPTLTLVTLTLTLNLTPNP